jgi:hypothetical protein
MVEPTVPLLCHSCSAPIRGMLNHRLKTGRLRRCSATQSQRLQACAFISHPPLRPLLACRATCPPWLENLSLTTEDFPSASLLSECCGIYRLRRYLWCVPAQHVLRRKSGRFPELKSISWTRGVDSWPVQPRLTALESSGHRQPTLFFCKVPFVRPLSMPTFAHGLERTARRSTVLPTLLHNTMRNSRREVSTPFAELAIMIMQMNQRQTFPRMRAARQPARSRLS